MMIGSRIALGVATALLAATAGCGTTSAAPPGQALPQLRILLSQVDAALADRHYPDARKALDALVRATTTARDTGQLSTEQADRILAAAAQLTAELPRRTPAPTVEPEPADDGEDGRANENDKKEDKGKRKPHGVSRSRTPTGRSPRPPAHARCPHCPRAEQSHVAV